MLKKKLTVTVVVLFLSISVIPYVVSDATTNGIIYVDDDGGADYTRIQDAIDNASDGDTVFVYSGTYYENVIIYKDGITLLGEDRENTIIDGMGNEGAIWIIPEYWTWGEKIFNVTVSGFTLRNAECENVLIVGDSNTFSDNIIIVEYELYCGVILMGSENLIENNDFDGGQGFLTDGFNGKVTNNRIIGNNFRNCKFAVELWSAKGNLFKNNNFYKSNENILIFGDQNSINNNTWMRNYWNEFAFFLKVILRDEDEDYGFVVYDFLPRIFPYKPLK